MLKISHTKTVRHLRNSLPKCLNKVLIFINVSDNVQIFFEYFKVIINAYYVKTVFKKNKRSKSYFKKKTLFAGHLGHMCPQVSHRLWIYKLNLTVCALIMKYNHKNGKIIKFWENILMWMYQLNLWYSADNTEQNTLKCRKSAQSLYVSKQQIRISNIKLLKMRNTKTVGQIGDNVPKCPTRYLSLFKLVIMFL